MNKNLNTPNESPTAPFIGYPTNSVFAVLDTPEQLERAMRDLETVGVSPDAAAVFCGDEGVRRIDATGKAHGLLGRLVRTVQLAADEGHQARRYEQQLKAGHYVVRVPIGSAKQKTLVRIALRANGGHFIRYYGPWVSETL